MDRSNLPVIVTDIDGVVIKWQSGLPYFAKKYNLPLQHILDMTIDEKFIPPEVLFDCDSELADKLIKKYNSSDFIRYLAPYSDALELINLLKKNYRFVAVTALGDDVDSMLNRKFNLNALFPDAFDDVLVCGHNESKENLLKKVNEKYSDKIVAFIDDMPNHIDTASKVLRCPLFWLPRGPRDKMPTCAYRKVKDWREIDLVLGAIRQAGYKMSPYSSGTFELQNQQPPFEVNECDRPKLNLDWWLKPVRNTPHVYPGVHNDNTSYPGVGSDGRKVMPYSLKSLNDNTVNCGSRPW